ncbi:hypothetical protein [Amaricoccus sp.]|uniref:hypothetical protein n=1 Tax=Amaricoccus sp. TaxID=1872485 RepID=UPI001B686A6E|nr:hypothetical protein [Amaricoccus sp.]MBP7003566.1 hypothetical protein [Amaricoccus sp.]
MGAIGPGLRYWLPETELTVTATKRKQAAAGARGSRLEEVVDVDLTHAAVADQTCRRLLQLDAGFLEKLDLTVTLDDRGFITAINSESGRDIAPVLSLVGKVISAVATVAMLGLRKTATTTGPTLEKQWEKQHPKLAAQLAALLAQVERLLGELGDPKASPGALRATARALDAVQSQVASIVEVRRAWIAAQAVEVATAVVRLRPFELLPVKGPDLPDLLPGTLPPQAPLGHARLVNDFGCALAIVDRDRAAKPQASDGSVPDVDRLYVRRSRPARVGVYVKGAKGWALEPDSALALDVVDRFSGTDEIPLDGSWLRTRSVELAWHPDMSLKTYGAKTVSSAGAVSASLGEALDAAAAAYKTVKEKPSAAAEALAKKKAEVDRLKTETEFEVLAAARQRAPAVAVAEQLRKLAGGE